MCGDNFLLSESTQQGPCAMFHRKTILSFAPWSLHRTHITLCNSAVHGVSTVLIVSATTRRPQQHKQLHDNDDRFLDR